MPSTFAVARAGRRARRAVPQARLDRARHRHRGGAERSRRRAPRRRSWRAWSSVLMTPPPRELGLDACASRRSMQVVADAQRVRHRGERRVHGAARGEEARVDDVEVVEVVRLAVDVERRGRRIGRRSAPCRTGARRRRAGSAGRGSTSSGSPSAWQPSWPSRPFSLRQQPPVRLGVVVVLARWMRPAAVDRHPVVRVRQVLGRQPEVDRVPRHVVQREPRGEPRRAGAQDVPVALAEHLDVPEREVEVVGAPVVVVDARASSGTSSGSAPARSRSRPS